MKVLAIGLGAEQIEAIRYARKIGLFVIGIDYSNQLPAIKYVNEFYCIDLSRELEIINYIRDKGIAFVIPSTIGKLLTTIGAINDALKLQGVTREAAQVITNKELYYKCLKQSDLYVPSRKVISNPTKKKLKDTITDDMLPCILKPSYGSGSRGVIIIDKVDLIENAVEYSIGEILENESIIIEEYVEGVEYGIDFRVEINELVLLSMREKTMTKNPYRQETGYKSFRPNDELHSYVESSLKKIMENFNGVQNCLGHADVILLKNGEVYFVEISLRPAGLGIMYNFLPYSIGFNPVYNMIDVLTTRSVYKYPEYSELYFAMHLLDLPKGEVIEIPSNDMLVTLPFLRKFEVNLYVGQLIHEVKSGKDILHRGYFIVESINEENAIVHKELLFDFLKVM